MDRHGLLVALDTFEAETRFAPRWIVVGEVHARENAPAGSAHFRPLEDGDRLLRARRDFHAWAGGVVVQVRRGAFATDLHPLASRSGVFEVSG